MRERRGGKSCRYDSSKADDGPGGESCLDIMGAGRERGPGGECRVRGADETDQEGGGQKVKRPPKISE